MIMRIWRTHVDETRAAEYERFATEESLPMFNAQPGFRGLLFGRTDDACVVVTLWEDTTAVDALDASPSYRETVTRISAAGFLRGPSSVERLTVHGSQLPGE
jgi:heme-degrading monooxygenase HmoA